MTPEWKNACIEMTRDVDAVAKALFKAGVKKVTVKDFHRTGYNLISRILDSRVNLISGYHKGPVPGVGIPPEVSSVMFLGMHAASGSPGFLAHTLTSRIRKLTVNGYLWAEVGFFSASLAPFGIKPIFFSGCPVACAQAKKTVPGISCFEIDKSVGAESFHVGSWRTKLAHEAVLSLDNASTSAYMPNGPFRAVVSLRTGKSVARKLSRQWGFKHKGSDVIIEADTFPELYMHVIRVCYLTPLIEKMLPLNILKLYNLLGWAGLKWMNG